MKLSREKSKLIKGVMTLVLVGGVTVGGITMYGNVFPNDRDTKASDTKLHEFMFANVYLNKKAKPQEQKAKDMFSHLFDHYMRHIDELPEFNRSLLGTYSEKRIVADYLSSFTDQYCVRKFKDIYVPTCWSD